MNQKKKMRYSEEELSLMRDTFNDDNVLQSLRKFLWGEAKPIDLFKQPAIKAILRKTFFPEMDSNAPISQVADLWLTLVISDKNPTDAYPFVQARNRLIKYYKSKFDILDGKEIEMLPVTIQPEPSDDKEETYIALITRNEIVAHTEQQLQQIFFLSSTSKEKLDELIAKNSAE